MPQGCNACKLGVDRLMPFTMAFQPIVDIEAGRVYAYEALVRGPGNESAYSVLSQVTEENRYSFDQSCRVTAIGLASRLGLAETGANLSINFMPGAVYSPAACIQLTLRTAEEMKFPLNRLIFEITEGEEVQDPAHLGNIAFEYRRHGFRVALDDFGAGYSNLNLLADLRVDLLKLDMGLIRGIDQRPDARRIVHAIGSLCRELGTLVIAEGIETVAEYRAIEACGISLIQGYLLAKPGFETLPEFLLPSSRVHDAVQTLGKPAAKTLFVMAS